MEIDAQTLSVLGMDFCNKFRCFPLVNGSVKTFATDKYEELAIEALELRLGTEISLEEMDAREFEELYKKLNSQAEETTSTDWSLIQAEIEVEDEGSIEKLKEKSQAEPVVKLVKDVIEGAIQEGATDIHVEPGEEGVKIRYRKDGMLRDKLDLPKWIQAPLVSRVKILSDLDIAEKRLPHDGRMKWVYRGDSMDIRVSTLPTRLGEKVVLRILRHRTHIADLHKLGMPPYILNSIKQIIHKPQGIFFVTGPTGSGKSSTLYAALREILHKDINICTVEDPIEYRLNGANQVQVNEKAGLNFSTTLRSLLRQDPDVMLVGEIRDEETAFMALQAAQTGHLVFSTLHTNDSVSALTRLLDLKVKPFLIGSALIGVMAQRLIRKICPDCHKWEAPTPDQKALLPNLPDSCPVEVGCKNCDFTGFKGRMGVFELLLLNSELRNAIQKGLSESEIKSMAKVNTLQEDAMEKLKQGLTTVSELLRVVVGEH